MVFAYVRLPSSLKSKSARATRIHALLLPSTDGSEWAELEVRSSRLGGYGVFASGGHPWTAVADTPVTLPFFGVETVVENAFLYKALVAVLKGEFHLVTVDELQARHGGQPHVASGLFAVPQDAEPRVPLPPDTQLLQVKAAGGGANYLLADDVTKVLHVGGKSAHLFRLLCAHERHEHADRHLGTHLTVVKRMEADEAGEVSPHHVLINAHPAFGVPESISGMVNEPAARQTPSLRMTNSYAHFLPNDDPLMKQLKLTQPAGAEAAWRKHVLEPMGVNFRELAIAGDGTSRRTHCQGCREL